MKFRSIASSFGVAVLYDNESTPNVQAPEGVFLARFPLKKYGLDIASAEGASEEIWSSC